ncbi:MAG: hypothetical protein GY757_55625 [bacterium]|nr:hypothetical protein [bacterium]
MKKKLILKALTDAKFRKLLEANPQEAFNMADVKGGQFDPQGILDAVKAINKSISDIGEYILCTGGGNCGIC